MQKEKHLTVEAIRAENLFLSPLPFPYTQGNFLPLKFHKIFYRGDVINTIEKPKYVICNISDIVKLRYGR